MTRRKDGRYQEAITINKKRIYFYGKTKAEVLKKINEYKQKEEAGKLFKEVADEWDTEHRQEVSYNAHRAYSVPYRECVDEFGDSPINNISVQDIDIFIKQIAAKGFAKRTVRGYLSLLSLIFNFAIRKGYCVNNPTSVISVPSKLKTTKRELPSESDVDLIKKSRNAHFGLFAYFLLYTGCRRGEALAIKYEDIDFKNKTISINKSLYWEGNKPVIKETKTTAGTRTIILLDKLAQEIPKGKDFLFGGKNPLTSTTFRYHWKKYTQETGVKLTPHQLRHLFATILYECGIDEKVTQELMGHSSISVTRNIYTHIRDQKMKEAAEKLNNLVI